MRGHRGRRGERPADGSGSAGEWLFSEVARGERHEQLHRLARVLRLAPDSELAAGDPLGRQVIELRSDGLTTAGTMIRYGHQGRPALVFPSDQGKAFDFEQNGMVEAVAGLIFAGRLKVYCVDGYDAWSSSGSSSYEAWVAGQVVPWIHRDCGGRTDIAAIGCSSGASHAASFAFKRADLFPLALCFSGTYDALDYVARLNASQLNWLRHRVRLLLVCGQGAWEDTTGSLDSTRRFAELLAAKGIYCELDLWSSSFPHDWSSWQAQLAHHMPRFC